MWSLPNVSREIRHWRARAEAIPDDALRADALEAIQHKRANIDGAGLFSTLPHARSSTLLRLLVAYEILADFLDCTSERGAHIGTPNGLQLHQALVEALDPRLVISDYYQLHPWRADGGYLRALVQTCRALCSQLPSYDAAQPHLERATRLALVLALNHEPEPAKRDALLKQWAARHFPGESHLTWFECTGGASAWLTVLALLAVAADDHGAHAHARAQATFDAYLPWISLTGTMLDSYGDQSADEARLDHSYIAHYSSPELAIHRIGAVVRRSLREAEALPNGSRHLILTSCMIAMYLSKDSVRTATARVHTRTLLRSAGPLTRLLVPVLRIWRVLYNQRTT
jgi:tetraprenyl-beta-curcumene synthase